MTRLTSGANHMGSMDFREWFLRAIERRGVTTRHVAVQVGTDYTHLWRMVKGDRGKYPSHVRPGFEVTAAIGEYLGDRDGALIAAGYIRPGDETPTPAQSSGGRVQVIDGMTFVIEDEDGGTLEIESNPNVRDLLRNIARMQMEARKPPE